MADHIVEDSAWASIAVHEVGNGTTVTSSTPIGTMIVEGAKHGLLQDTPYLGQDGNYHGSVDCGARIRVDAFSGAVTSGQSLYWSGTAFTTTVTGNAIGFAYRAKGAASGPLYVQLVMTAA